MSPRGFWAPMPLFRPITINHHCCGSKNWGWSFLGGLLGGFGAGLFSRNTVNYMNYPGVGATTSAEPVSLTAPRNYLLIIIIILTMQHKITQLQII